MRYLNYHSAVVLVVSLALAGCGGAAKETGSISGTVTFNQQPVMEGTVVFNPTGNAGYVASAEIQSDGTYQVVTQDGGLIPGEYVAVVQPTVVRLPDTETSPGAEEFKKADNIPAKYRSSKTSGLTLTVTPGKQVFDIQMQTP